MADAPQNALPLLYKDLVPLSSVDHASWKTRQLESAPWLQDQHAIPVTVDEFASAQRFFPIIFSAGDSPVPLALLGLNEGVNVFMGEDGKFTENVYVPAYVRRYPFMLAKLRPDTDELSVCFDPTADAIGPFDEGDALFEDGQPAEATKQILEFCEQFEQAGQRTEAFMKDLVESELLMDGELSIQPDAEKPPFIYRGFQMVNEEKLRDLRGDQLRKMNQSGLLPLVYAHLFSLAQMREVFGRQLAQGKVAEGEAQS
ncbi:MAG: multidrug transporter [Sphingomonadaceae bacterium]|nr:multidrug transporter [Sphingomonadaceae bacterium]